MLIAHVRVSNVSLRGFEKGVNIGQHKAPGKARQPAARLIGLRSFSFSAEEAVSFPSRSSSRRQLHDGKLTASPTDLFRSS